MSDKDAEITRLRAEVERLAAENASLASWQCEFTDGKTGLVYAEGGGSYCAMAKKMEKLQAALLDAEKESKYSFFEAHLDQMGDANRHLRAEVERLARDYETAREAHDRRVRELDAHCVEVARLRAENQKLRAALRGCIAMLEQLGYTPISKVARTALEQPTDE